MTKYNIPTAESLIQDSGFTPMPHFFEDIVMPKVEPAAWKILTLFIRNTYGFHRDEYSIDIIRISEKTGLGIRSAQKHTKDLVDAGLLIITRDESKRKKISRKYKLISGDFYIN